MEEFRFEDLEPIAIPVTIGKKAYILREATGDDACKWRKYLFRSTKMEGGKPIMSMDTLADSEPLLLSYCMHEEYADKNGETKERKVDLQVIRAYAPSVLRVAVLACIGVESARPLRPLSYADRFRHPSCQCKASIKGQDARSEDRIRNRWTIKVGAEYPNESDKSGSTG
jgi:hypothetical protein